MPASTALADEFIRIRGARTHNLQNIDVDIPRNKLVVITGVSGSGKSSLAFDTLLAEGQRQYIDSLSIYARQFFDQMPRPQVDHIEGLQPTVAIDQQPGHHNPRSTVGTITEIYDYLRLLMARAGQVHCPACQTPIAQQTPAEIEEAIRGLPQNTRVQLLAPLVRGRKGKHADVFEQIRKAGFVRARVDGEIYLLEDVPELVPQKVHEIEAVVDRLKIREEMSPRLGESVRLALKHGDGVLGITFQTEAQRSKDAKSWESRVFNTLYACPRCQRNITEIEPRTFSFNSPYGACPACGGMGKTGDDDTQETCTDCNGTRLRAEARACRLGGLRMHEITAMPMLDALTFFQQLELDELLKPVGEPSIREIVRRLEFLIKVGAQYLSLDRPADTLSGGEMQRVRLATGIGSGLVGVLYLLDEPSIGLHPRDNDRLIDSLRDLQQQGNSVVVVEHDESIMRSADHLLDMGPAAGGAGGRVVAQGAVASVTDHRDSLTAAYLSKREQIDVPTSRRKPNKSNVLQLRGASANNLRDIAVEIPLGLFVCVTGVSGSGKSSLVVDTLGRALARKLHNAAEKPSPYQSLRGVTQLQRCVRVDQTPIGRTPRSNAATYTGVFDEIRKVFAGTKQARQRGYKLGRFSFNVKAGRCEECQGQGAQKIEMSFLTDFYVTCPGCHGARFNRQTLSIRFREKSIADVLDMSIDEASEFFENHPAIRRILDGMRDVGLGYLTLGQPSTTLSGGEAQRIKLATELSRAQNDGSLYLLDEPTTGLHSDDIRRLLAVLHRLVEQGSTVLVIEHNLDVLKTADWIIDLGPEGGGGGGMIVVEGTPEHVAQCGSSHTGRFLQAVLDGG